jgi:hypothetical protein
MAASSGATESCVIPERGSKTLHSVKRSAGDARGAGQLSVNGGRHFSRFVSRGQ